MEGKRQHKGEADIAKNEKIGGEDHKFEKNPQWLQDRVAYFDSLFVEQQKVYEGKLAAAIN